MMTSDCPACHGSRAMPFFDSVKKDFSLDGYSYLKCDTCLSVFNGDSPDQEALTSLHREQWYSSGTFRYPDAGRDRALHHWTTTVAAADAAVQRRRGVAPTHLDIGCGYGVCCEALRLLGYHSTGIDPSPDSIEAASREFPLNTFATVALGESGLPDIQGAFDLVTLNDVLEHVVSPDVLMREVARLVGVGGVAYIQVPSAESLQLEYLREHAFHSMAPFHRTLFSRSGLTALLERSGFAIAQILPSHINWGWTRALSFQLERPGDYERLREDEGFRKLDLAIDTLFDRIAIDAGRGPSLRVVAHRVVQG